MFKHGIAIVLILVALVLVCSCKSEPEMTKDVERVASVGLVSSSSIVDRYAETGSYTGVSHRVGDNAICYTLSNASITIDLSSIEATMGTHTITVSGEIVYDYEAYSATYAYSVSYNVRFAYAGKDHTLEIKGRWTGVSSTKVSLLKVDGTSYDPSFMNQ